jgi:hypothetical protein
MFSVSCDSDNSSIFRKDFEKQFTTSYSEKDLIPEISLRLFGDPEPIFLSYINERFPGRKVIMFEDSPSYAVFKLKEGGYCYLFFRCDEDESGITNGTAIGAFVVKNQLKKSNLDVIELNKSTLKDITSIDRGLETLIKHQKSAKSMLITTPLKTFHLVDNGFAEITYNFDEKLYLEENPNIGLHENIRNGVREDLYKYFSVNNINFIENGGLLFEEAYSEKERVGDELITKIKYKKYNTTLKQEDFPFK